MRNQTIFNKVIKHLRKQGCRSVSEDGRICAYRGSDDTQCAAGILIKDAEYHTEFEGQGVDTLRDEGSYFLSSQGFTKDNVNLLSRLQGLHDSASAFLELETEAQSIAADYKLKVPRVP
jgi:hypothetical protein